MEIQKDYFIKLGGVIFLVIIGLFLIRVFNISYPVKVDLISSERTSEFAVIGEGKIDIVPDMVYISTGIRVEGEKSIKLKDINRISSVIERVTSAGANEVSGVVFDIDKPEEARKKARDKAIENAKKQAKELSNNLGIKLGKIVNLVESSSSRIPN